MFGVGAACYCIRLRSSKLAEWQMRTTRADTYRSARIRSSEVFLEESSETQHDCPPLVDVSTSLISGGCSTPAPSVSSEKNAAPQAFSREGARKHAFSEVVSSAELILKPMEVESEPTPRTPFIGDISISPDWSPYLQISSPAFPLRSARARHLWHNSGTEQVTLQLPKVPYVSPRQSAPTSARSLAGNFRANLQELPNTSSFLAATQTYFDADTPSQTHRHWDSQQQPGQQGSDAQVEVQSVVAGLQMEDTAPRTVPWTLRQHDDDAYVVPRPPLSREDEEAHV
eukprot:Tamp_18980.p1 GENE.Tamp_18980~~Tamp_18980.p1  ORF type:complete len:285 (+),score=12.74 Tamp_18980:143-997(+)